MLAFTICISDKESRANHRLRTLRSINPYLFVAKEAGVEVAKQKHSSEAVKYDTLPRDRQEQASHRNTPILFGSCS